MYILYAIFWNLQIWGMEDFAVLWTDNQGERAALILLAVRPTHLKHRFFGLSLVSVARRPTRLATLRNFITTSTLWVMQFQRTLPRLQRNESDRAVRRLSCTGWLQRRGWDYRIFRLLLDCAPKGTGAHPNIRVIWDRRRVISCADRRCAN